MWDKIEKYLPMFESAVLSVPDARGYPYSVRCRPRPDRSAGLLKLDPAPHGDLRSGPASLLCHSHDENTWNQRVFVLRGKLEGDGEGWAFRPEKFIPSIGTAGIVGAAGFLIGARRATAAYLKKRRPGPSEDPLGRGRSGQESLVPAEVGGVPENGLRSP